ncbi:MULTISPECIES: M23 family metallopeptidase [Streptomyces]|uniref:M23 family metallopeptidase n=1 Tax=Streptomyces TaxID=1883 RepID=UPI0004C4A597|nr:MULTISPECIES: M23 family metallopeptidase [Streptomyces]RPK94453.1 Glycyl-glycine endopeptidase LytM precursor [Streptomyces sp. ADI98-10]
MSVRKAMMVLYRACWLVFVALVLIGVFTEPLLPFGLTFVPAGMAVIIGLALSRTGSRTTPTSRPAVELDPPVTGRWSALNSPADKVPSHGTHAYGQTYAIDIVAEPGTGEEGEPSARPPFRLFWPVVRRNRDFPAFGAPLFAVADATVVRARDGQRDHLSRNSLPGLFYLMLIEGGVRDMLGASRIIGNHVILDLGDSTYAVYAHVQRGSLQVKAGDTVRAGQRLGRVGNSGNTTEPHLHFHLMDGPDPDDARGIPFTWRGVGVPANGETFTVEEIEEIEEQVAQAWPGDVGGAG